MGRIANQIRAAAEGLRIHVDEISTLEAQRIYDTVKVRFTDGSSGWLWEHWAAQSESIADPRGWEAATEFIGDRPCIMLFNPFEEGVAFSFQSGRDVCEALANCSNFEFYLTDSETTFILAFNHHDCLFAVGEAAVKWLLSIKEPGLQR
jgi:hypothetical protein